MLSPIGVEALRYLRSSKFALKGRGSDIHARQVWKAHRPRDTWYQSASELSTNETSYTENINYRVSPHTKPPCEPLPPRICTCSTPHVGNSGTRGTIPGGTALLNHVFATRCCVDDRPNVDFPRALPDLHALWIFCWPTKIKLYPMQMCQQWHESQRWKSK